MNHPACAQAGHWQGASNVFSVVFSSNDDGPGNFDVYVLQGKRPHDREIAQRLALAAKAMLREGGEEG